MCSYQLVIITEHLLCARHRTKCFVLCLLSNSPNTPLRWYYQPYFKENWILGGIKECAQHCCCAGDRQSRFKFLPLIQSPCFPLHSRVSCCGSSTLQQRRKRRWRAGTSPFGEWWVCEDAHWMGSQGLFVTIFSSHQALAIVPDSSCCLAPRSSHQAPQFCCSDASHIPTIPGMPDANTSF